MTDDSGFYTALYRPYHLIGLELGISVVHAALQGEATGAPTGFRGDVVATAKRDLAAGEELDGEGGYAVYGRLMPAEDSGERGATYRACARYRAAQRCCRRRDGEVVRCRHRRGSGAGKVSPPDGAMVPGRGHR